MVRGNRAATKSPKIAREKKSRVKGKDKGKGKSKKFNSQRQGQSQETVSCLVIRK